MIASYNEHISTLKIKEEKSRQLEELSRKKAVELLGLLTQIDKSVMNLADQYETVGHNGEKTRAKLKNEIAKLDSLLNEYREKIYVESKRILESSCSYKKIHSAVEKIRLIVPYKDSDRLINEATSKERVIVAKNKARRKKIFAKVICMICVAVILGTYVYAGYSTLVENEKLGQGGRDIDSLNIMYDGEMYYYTNENGWTEWRTKVRYGLYGDWAQLICFFFCISHYYLFFYLSNQKDNSDTGAAAFFGGTIGSMILGIILNWFDWGLIIFCLSWVVISIYYIIKMYQN